MSNQVIILVEFVVYLAAMIGIGAYYARKELSSSDFHLGGKKLSGWALALSERSTGESAWLILGLTGLAYAEGLSVIWTGLGCITGIFLSWIFLARKFREEADKYGALTFTDYFAIKFNRFGKHIRWFASLIIILFYVLYVAAQFGGGGKTLQITFGISKMWGILITAGIVTLYSMAGGFLSVVWSDVVQAILMICTFIVTPIILLFQINQKNLSIMTSLANHSDKMASWTGGLIGLTAGIMIMNHFSWVLGYLGGQPQLSTRWMAMKNDEDAKQGMWVAIIWTILAYAGAIIIGLCAFTLFGASAVKDPEQILPFTLMQTMPPWLAGILLVGAVAAMMSTASSQLLVATSAISEDVYHKAMNKDLTDAKLVTLSRISMLGVGLFGLIMAFTSKSLIYTIVGWAWAGIGCSFSPAILLSFFWKRTSSAGILASMIGGFVITIIWMTTGLDKIFTAKAAAFIIALAFAVIFSIFAPDKPVEELTLTEQKN